MAQNTVSSAKRSPRAVGKIIVRCGVLCDSKKGEVNSWTKLSGEYSHLQLLSSIGL